MGSFSLIEIIAIIFIHFISDFVMQDEKWALGKSKNWGDLLSHTYVYTIIWLIPLIIIRLYGGYDLLNQLFGSPKIMWFFPITFILHTITDYITSRIVSRRFGKEEIFTLTINGKIYKVGDILDKDNTYSYIIMSKIEPSFANKHNYRIKLYNPIPNLGAFTLVGLDQVLHYIQLFGTYYLLVNM